MLYERSFSAAHLLIWFTMGVTFDISWYLAAHQHAPLWARLCAAGATSGAARPIEAALARRHARRRAGRR
ncbi:hypothetical protein [Streptomyces sp. NBC_00239]|uniref:hypothetical protein n=1 Tax=Streptomyces sp. NBC_00239 TaxID=2903640 RepID=UPI002E2894DD|nr:hypothetical protein [Streptomyces sp. NBC_00239]